MLYAQVLQVDLHASLAFVPSDESVYDTKVDVWSAGVLAYELARMAPPYADVKSVFQVMMLIVNDAPPTLVEGGPSASDEGRAFVRDALVKEPAARPSARALLAHGFVAHAAPDALVGVLATRAADAERDAAAAPTPDGGTMGGTRSCTCTCAEHEGRGRTIDDQRSDLRSDLRRRRPRARSTYSYGLRLRLDSPVGSVLHPGGSLGLVA